MHLHKKAALIQSAVFAIFIGALCVLHFAIPDKTFSEQENRSLQTAPRFRLSSLFSGSLTSSLEDYVTDQFPFRDNWTSLKARCELLSGKDENNGVYLCAGETLLEPYSAPTRADMDARLDAVNALTEHAEVPVYFALIPSASEIWREMLPEGAPNDSQQTEIDYAYSRVSAQTIDICSVLDAHSDETIFYRTDHHWTMLGAYYGYTAVAQAMGLDPVPLDAYTETVVSDSFYGTTYSASGFRWVAPDTISTYVEQGDATITNYPSGTAEPGTLYDESYLLVKDKYSYFFGGNTPLLTIETGNAGPSLLIVRDSYMDSLSPFLFTHFSEIHILDLRYYRSSLQAYLDANDFSAVLVCYSLNNFSTETSLLLLGG